MNGEREIEHTCKECGEKFPRELVEEFILKEKTVYCEKCGYPYKIISKGMSDSRKTTVYNARSSIKSQNNQETNYNNKSSPNYPTRNAPRSYHIPSPPQIPNAPRPPRAPRPPIVTPKNQRTPENTLVDMKVWINKLNRFVKSPILFIIGILISAGRFSSSFFTEYPIIPIQIDIIVKIIAIILIYNITVKDISTKITNGDFSNLGVDAIIFGVIGLPCYGLTIPLLAEGILIITYESLRQKNNLIDNKITADINYEIAAVNMIERSIHVIKGSLFESTSILIILGISKLNWWLFAFLIISLGMDIYIKKSFIPKLESVSVNNVTDEYLIWAIVFSGLSLTFMGAGAILLTITILIFVYKGMVSDIKSKKKLLKLPDMNEEETNEDYGINEKETNKEYGIKEESVSKSITLTEDKPKFVRDIPHQDVKPVPLPSINQVNVTKKQNIPENNLSNNDEIPKKLHQIPIKPPSKKDTPQIDEASRQELIKALRKNEDPNEPSSIQEEFINQYMDKLFIVLTDDIRQRILKLEIPEEQKWDIFREFVNLKEEQQAKYLEELENVNRSISKVLIKKIMNLNISANEKQDLINQLEFMEPKEQLEFIEFITQTQN